MLLLLVLLFVVSLKAQERLAQPLHLSEFSFSYPDRRLDTQFWTKYGTAALEADGVRLTDIRQSEQGAIWCSTPVNFQYWEVNIKTYIGSEHQLGADGLAIWYTKERGFLGPAFGNKNKFTGIGVVLDSFDNDGQRDQPNIYLILNDGTHNYDASSDGANLIPGGSKCGTSFRGFSTEDPFQIKIRYSEGLLSVFTKQPKNDEYNCFEVDMVLPEGYYFGVSAATGGIADYHYVVAFETFALSRPQDKASPRGLRFSNLNRHDGVSLTELTQPEDYSALLASVMGQDRDLASRLAMFTLSQYEFAVQFEGKFRDLEKSVQDWNAHSNERVSNVQISVNEIINFATQRDKVIKGLDAQIQTLKASVTTFSNQLKALHQVQEQTYKASVESHSQSEESDRHISSSISSGDSTFNWLFWLVVIEVIVAIVFSILRRRKTNLRKSF